MFGLGLTAAMAVSEPILRTPDIHGDKIVFSCEGDLWLGSISKGTAERITTDPGVEQNPSFSPDGKMIAFEGEYDDRQAYVMPTEGGPPKKLTYAEGFRAVTGWTPDGSQVLFRKSNVPTNYEHATVPAQGGAITKLPLEFSSHLWFGKTSDEYAFTRFNRWYSAWFRYIGGMQNQVWIRRNGSFKQLTDVQGTNEFPVWLKDRIYFVNEDKAQFTLMSIGVDGGKARAELPASDLEIRELSTDGEKLIFEKGLDVEVFDPAAKTSSKVSIQLSTDSIHSRPYHVPAGAFFSAGSATPSGKRALVESRGAILSLPFGEGEARIWKQTPGVRFRKPVMSPDGKLVAYLSDEGGEQDIWVSDALGGSPKKVTSGGRRQFSAISWSPDSKTIAYTDSLMNLRVVGADGARDRKVATVPFNWFGIPVSFSPDSRYLTYSQTIPVTNFGAIEIYELATDTVKRVSNGWANDTAPSFSSDGKHLVFLSFRSVRATDDAVLNQMGIAPGMVPCVLTLRSDLPDPLSPVDSIEPAPAAPAAEAKKEDGLTQIDWDGLADRRIELPMPAGPYNQIAMVGSRVIVGGGGSINAFDLDSKKVAPVTEGGFFDVTSDRSKLVLTDGTGLITVALDSGKRERTDFGSLRLPISPRAEWNQIFWDSWRLLRDYFYLENMHGLDWPAIGRKYEALLPRINSRSELDELIRWMQAEIGSSHQYLSDGDTRDLKRRTPGAYLGIDIAADPSGRYRITKVLRGDNFTNSERSPLLAPNRTVKEGMFLLAIGGQELKTSEDPWAGLAGRAGKTVGVTLGDKPSMEGAKTFLVKPVPSEARMRYISWVQENRDYVTKKSNGRLGYLHLAAMGGSDVEDFVRQYFAQRNKEGFVIDSRYNNGGYVQEFINRILNASLDGFFNMRNSPQSWSRQQDYFTGPMAMLINEFNISCGEELPHRFKGLNRGVLIGRRTMGGEVGSSPGWPLIDGGVINVPNYGMWVPGKGWAIEGRGVSPDIDVPSDPNAYVAGRDPQIDKAIEWLLAELKKKPALKIVEPAPRDRVKEPLP